MRVLFAIIIALLVVQPALAQTTSTPTAVLVQKTGDIRIRRGDATLPGAVGTALMVGDRIQIGADARATVLHSTGRVEVMQASGRIAASGSTPTPAFAQTLETLAQIATTDARSQPNRQGMIRPAPGTAVPVSPRNGIRILDPTPEFVWLSIPGASSYTIQLRPANGEPVRYVTDADTTWAVPDSATLAPGVTYDWTAGRTDDARTAPIQSFRMASDEERQNLETVFDEIRSWGLDPEGDGLFLTALAYRNAGFFYDADEALDRIAERDGEQGKAYHLLRGEVYDALGRLDDAAREFEIADALPGA